MNDEESLASAQASSSDSTVPPVSDYAEKVGSRLREVRKGRRLSLQAVESQSGSEFKASVLGAYERGERAISVPRLQRLARFYQVSVDHLLPHDLDEPLPSYAIDLRGGEEAVPQPGAGRVTIDLRRLGDLGASERELLSRYLGMIQLQRHGSAGYLITIRHEDLRAIACLLETTAEGARRRLNGLAAPARPSAERV